MTGHELFSAIAAALGPEARRHWGVDAPGRRDMAIAGGSYRAIGALVDGIRAGDGDQPVVGVAVCARASMSVLEQAWSGGANLVISRTAFLNDSMDRPVARPEPALAAKLAFIAAHNIMVMRLQDARTGPAGRTITEALGSAIGLSSLPTDDPAAGLRYALPAPLRLGELVGRVRQALPAPALRLLGDPAMPVTGIAVATETNRPNALNPLLADPAINLLICGEVHETETAAYLQDAQSLGQPKAMLLTGAIPAEEPAARALARWLPAIVDVPVSYLPSPEGLVVI